MTKIAKVTKMIKTSKTTKASRTTKMRKSRIVLLFLVLAMLLPGMPALASDSPPQPLTIELNGIIVPTPPDTRILEDQVMVPLRWAAERLGARSIQWDGENRNVTIETDPDLQTIKKLSSYVNGLTPRDADREAEIWPIPDSVKGMDLPLIRDRQLVLNLEAEKLEPSANPFKFAVTVTLVAVNDTDADTDTDSDSDSDNGDKVYQNAYMVYSAENYNDRVFLPMDWLEELFYADVDYNEAANRLSIKARDQQETERQIAAIEGSLIPATPEEAIKLWGRGEQTRSGALQYAALSPAMRQQAYKRILESGWVTGFSSPWVGPVTVKEEKVLSDQAVEYTVTFPELTSDPFTPIATEKMVVEKFDLDGKEGWFITEMPQSSGYGVIAGSYENSFVGLPDVNVFLPLPSDWRIEKNNRDLSLKNNQGNTIGSIEQLGGYYLPNHSLTLSDQKMVVSFGEGHLLVLARSAPAAAGTGEEWQEVHAILPFKEQVWIDLSVRVSPENDVEQLKTILERAIMEAVYFIPE